MDWKLLNKLPQSQKKHSISIKKVRHKNEFYHTTKKSFYLLSSICEFKSFSTYLLNLFSMAFFFFFSTSIRFSLLSSFFFISFLNRYAWSSNGETPTIYKYFKLLSHSTSVFDCFFRLLFLCVFFFDILFSFSFRQLLSSPHYSDFRLHLKGSLIFWSSFSRRLCFFCVFRVHSISFSVFLIYYFVMWAEFACIELLTRKPEWDLEWKREKSFAVDGWDLAKIIEILL